MEGPRASGKTATAARAAASEVLLDIDDNARRMIGADPAAVLIGDTPRLIDEWQLEPAIWNHVRREIDRRGAPGQFILTGSAVPGRRHHPAHRRRTFRPAAHAPAVLVRKRAIERGDFVASAARRRGATGGAVRDVDRRRRGARLRRWMAGPCRQGAAWDSAHESRLSGRRPPHRRRADQRQDTRPGQGGPSAAFAGAQRRHPRRTVEARRRGRRGRPRPQDRHRRRVPRRARPAHGGGETSRPGPRTCGPARRSDRRRSDTSSIRPWQSPPCAPHPPA